MNGYIVCRFLAVLVAAIIATVVPRSEAKIIKSSEIGFAIEHELMLPVPPMEAYDAMTGDVSGWWDHSFSETPVEFYIDPRPGGAFMEIFDKEGNGVLHATVTYAHRGKLLRMEGPLGLAGNPFTLVMTFVYERHDGGTLVEFKASAMGEMEEGWAEAVDGVWHHFLFERLKPYVEAGKHKQRD